jgi:uncharacterized ferritin-like protein (DUF455 family)
MMLPLFQQIEEAWHADTVETKCAAVDALIPAYMGLTLNACLVETSGPSAPDACHVGRPSKPLCVPPSALPFRKAIDVEGRAALLHAIAHIEFNAINLALDAAWRFSALGAGFVRDWVGVAIEEAYHFHLIHDRLTALGYRYGDLPAHSGLWQLAEQTAGDELARMALVPRLMEARGLDAMPPIFRAFQGIGDKPTLRVLAVIARDEIRHVALGDRWFRQLCQQQQRPVVETYHALMSTYDAPWPRPPLNEPARRAAGFADEELARLRTH